MLYPSAGSAEVEQGRVHPQDCEVCGREQPFRLVLTYRYERLFGVFGNVRGRSYLLICEVCGTAWRVPATAARKLAGLQSDPIPFLHRFGWLLLFIVLVVLVLVSWLSEALQPK